MPHPRVETNWRVLPGFSQCSSPFFNQITHDFAKNKLISCSLGLISMEQVDLFPIKLHQIASFFSHFLAARLWWSVKNAGSQMLQSSTAKASGDWFLKFSQHIRDPPWTPLVKHSVQRNEVDTQCDSPGQASHTPVPFMQHVGNLTSDKANANRRKDFQRMLNAKHQNTGPKLYIQHIWEQDNGQRTVLKKSCTLFACQTRSISIHRLICLFPTSPLASISSRLLCIFCMPVFICDNNLLAKGLSRTVGLEDVYFLPPFGSVPKAAKGEENSSQWPGWSLPVTIYACKAFSCCDTMRHTTIPTNPQGMLL